MNNSNPNLKISAISIINSLLTLLIWLLMTKDQSASLGYMFFLFIAWLIFGIITGLVIYKEKVKIRSWNLLLFIFCTPIPFLIAYKITSKESVVGTYEYKKNSRRIKEITYDHKKEFLSSIDTITENNQFPENENYRLDSIIYFDRNNNLLKTEHFK